MSRTSHERSQCSTANYDFDVCIVGAGVVGCSIAMHIQNAGHSVVVIDVNDKQGQGITSRNSEVIHAGIYYAEGSLKAKFCVDGRRQIYALAQQYGIDHRQTGKFVVATHADQVERLHSYLQQAQRNGVEGVRLVSGDYVQKHEPSVFAVEAMEVPVSGLISAHALCDFFQAQAANAGAQFAFRTGVREIHRENDAWITITDTVNPTPKSAVLDSTFSGPPVVFAENPFRIKTQIFINSAGLYADWIAKLAGMNIDDHHYRLRWLKGEYYMLPSSWGKRIHRLIYPLPLPNLKSVGIHCTLDLGGQVRLGPSAMYLNRIEDYIVQESNRAEFFNAARSYLPTLTPEELVPAYAGIRPKLSAEGEPARDFVISDETSKGFPGLINLIGIDSPGLTSSPAIGAYVANLVEEML